MSEIKWIFRGFMPLGDAVFTDGDVLDTAIVLYVEPLGLMSPKKAARYLFAYESMGFDYEEEMSAVFFSSTGRFASSVLPGLLWANDCVLHSHLSAFCG